MQSFAVDEAAYTTSHRFFHRFGCVPGPGGCLPVGLRWGEKRGAVSGEQFEQLAGMEGAIEEFEAEFADHLAFAGAERGGGKENDAAGGVQLAHAPGGFDAADATHADVGEDDVGPGGFDPFQGVFAAVEGGGFVSLEPEDGGQGVGDEVFVIDDEDLALGLGGGRRQPIGTGISHPELDADGRRGCRLGDEKTGGVRACRAGS